MEFKIPLSEIQTVEGQTAKLSCELSKSGVHTIWLKDGKQFTSDERCQIIVNGCFHELVIQNVTLEDEAEYTVQISETVSSKATLWVEGMLSSSNK